MFYVLTPFTPQHTESTFCLYHFKAILFEKLTSDTSYSNPYNHLKISKQFCFRSIRFHWPLFLKTLPSEPALHILLSVRICWSSIHNFLLRMTFSLFFVKHLLSWESNQTDLNKAFSSFMFPWTAIKHSAHMVGIASLPIAFTILITCTTI